VISDHLFLFQTGFTGSLGFKRNLTAKTQRPQRVNSKEEGSLQKLPALMCGEALMIEIKALEKLLG
jgi:hypothetical protein